MTPLAAVADRLNVSVAVQIGPALLTNNDLELVELREELGQHTTCSISFTRDRALDLKLDALLAADVTVRFHTMANQACEFTGSIASISQAAYGTGGSTFTLEIISKSVALEYRNLAYFPETTLAQLTSKLGAKLIGSGGKVKDEPLDFVQYGESDFMFLQRLADERGYFLRTAGPEVELCLDFIGTTHALTAGQNLLGISVSANPVNAGYKGSLYEPKEKKDTRLHGVRESDPGWMAGMPQLTKLMSRLSMTHAGGGDPNVEEFPARVKDLAAFREGLQEKSRRALGTSVRISGTSTLVTLSAGHKVMIASGQTMQLPQDFLGEYGLTRVVHRWDGRQYLNNFTATPWKGFTHEARPPRRLMPGPVTAFVVDNNDPQRMGRIRVRFFWQNTGEMTRWVRYVTPYAGNERGVAFLPEIGDEVLVAFEQGDPERPFIMGALWNGVDKTPAAPEKNTSKRIVTRSGNTLHLSDEDGKEVIELFSAKGTCYVRLANDDNGKPLVTIRSGGDLSLEAEGEIRMKCESLTQRVAQAATRIVGTNDVAKVGQNAIVKAGQNATIEAGANATLKAGANLNAVAAANNNIAGAMVQIQPPGLAVPPAQVQEPAEKKTVWKEQPTPKAVQGSSQNQVATPRSKR